MSTASHLAAALEWADMVLEQCVDPEEGPQGDNKHLAILAAAARDREKAVEAERRRCQELLDSADGN